MPDTIDQTIASLHDAGATDEEITGILKEKFGQPTRAEADPKDIASGIYDAPRSDAPGMLDVAKGFAKGAMNTVYQGGDLIRRATGMERPLQKPELQAALKPTNEAEKFGHMAETAVELAPIGVGVAKLAKATPGVVARGLGISGARAAENLSAAANAAKSVAIDVNAPGSAALRVVELGERGASVPRVVQTFTRRITDPSKGPLTFEEARDYYSNISRLSADEYNRLNPVVKRAVASMRETLNKSLTDAAGTVGKGEQYAEGMSEYARFSKAKAAAPKIGKAAAGAVGATAGLSLLQRILGGYK
jgi:hypothetical protein